MSTSFLVVQAQRDLAQARDHRTACAAGLPGRADQLRDAAAGAAGRNTARHADPHRVHGRVAAADAAPRDLATGQRVDACSSWRTNAIIAACDSARAHRPRRGALLLGVLAVATPVARRTPRPSSARPPTPQTRPDLRLRRSGASLVVVGWEFEYAPRDRGRRRLRAGRAHVHGQRVRAEPGAAQRDDVLRDGRGGRLPRAARRRIAVERRHQRRRRREDRPQRPACACGSTTGCSRSRRPAAQDAAAVLRRADA